MRYRNSWLNAKVSAIKNVAKNVREFQLVPEGDTVPFSVGSHLDFLLPINENVELRSYSLVGSYKKNEPYTVSVKQLESSRGGSAYMWTLKVGDMVKISQPTNHFELSLNTKTYLLIAGGIGITPILGMAEELSKKPDVNLTMLYLGRNPSEMPYLETLETLLGNRLKTHFSDEDGFFPLEKILNWADDKTQVYLCGPAPLMNAVRKTWEQSNYPNENLRFETFGASGLFAPQTFRVTIPRYNKTFEVKEQQTLLQAIEEQGIEMMHDCLKGECGLCMVDIQKYTGDIDHRDVFLSEHEKGENQKLCTCVSRVANGELNIDVPYRGQLA